MAAKRGHTAVMKSLLQHKNNPADPNAKKLRNAIGPVLNSAVLSGNVKGVQLLINNDGNPVIFDREDERFPLPLVLSARHSDIAAFEAILTAGRRNWQVSDYEKALLEASGSGREEIVGEILKLCFGMPREVFQNAIDEATSERNWDVANMLLTHCDNMTFERIDCEHLFRHAAITPREEVVDLLKTVWKYTGGLDQKIVNDSLFGAVDNEKEQTVRWLLETCGADPNAEGEK